MTQRASPALLRNLVGHMGAVTGCAVTDGGRRVVSTSTDGTLRIWDLETGRVLATLSGHAGAVMGCAMTLDGHRVVSASADSTLRVWDLDTGRVLAILEGHAGAVTSCTVTRDGRRVVSASADGSFRVWDLDTGRVLATWQDHVDVGPRCAVVLDDRRLVSASDDATLRVWDLDTGRLLATLAGHTDAVACCAVAPDRRRVISASADRTLRVWDLDSGRDLTTLAGHTGWVTSCAVASDGRRVVSGSSDTTLKVWDLDTRRVLTTLEGHASSIASCAITPDGARVISGAADDTLKLWRLDGPPTVDAHSTLGSGAVMELTTTTAAARRAARPSSGKHVILFLAANPDGTIQLALKEECAEIKRELHLATHGHDFEFRARSAVTVDQMARHLIKLQPTIIHFSGHGTAGASASGERGRDVVRPDSGGIYLQDEQSGSQLVTSRALAMMIQSTAPSARIVVLNACYTDHHAEALCSVVDCVVGMTRAIQDDAARSFAVAFYRALGHRRSVGNAVEHARATMAAKQLPDEGIPRCRTCHWVDANQIFLEAPPLRVM